MASRARTQHGNARLRALAFALLLLPTAAAWGQQGGDAGRTGVAALAGPEWGDLALRLTLPYGQLEGSLPVIAGREALLLGRDPGGSYVVQAVDVDSGSVRLIGPPASGAGDSEVPAWGLAVDGAQVVVVSPAGVDAWALDGARGWTWRADAPLGVCAPPAISADLLVVACRGPTYPSYSCVVVALARATGELRWSFEIEPASEASRARSTSECVPLATTLDATSLLLLARTRIAIPDTTGVPSRVILSLAAHELGSGTERWRAILESGIGGPRDLALSAAPPPSIVSTPVAASQGRVFTNVGALAMFDAAGSRVWADETVDPFPGGGVAFAGGDAFAATGAGLYRYAIDGTQAYFEPSAVSSGESWSPSGLALAGDDLFAVARRRDVASGNGGPEESYQVRAFDAASGRTRWSFALPALAGPMLEFSNSDELPRQGYEFALAERALVVTDGIREVFVLGRTGASMAPLIRAATAEPRLRERFSVDLGGSGAGATSGPVEYAVDWGDGARDDWQASPLFAHAYGDVGDFTARFHLRSASGLSASETAVFSVGTDAPAPPGESWSPWWALLALPVAAVAVAASARSRRKATPTPATPAGIEKYSLERKLGRGTFGEVWLATDKRLGRKVVLKQLHPTWSEPGEARERFEREARILASLDHPNVTRVFDVDLSARPFIVMEYVDGGSLGDLLGRGTLSVEDAARITLDLLDGLDAIHQRGIVHRDVKPSNVLLTRGGRVKLADFGVARASGAPDGLTSDGARPPGTPAYMAPEQLRGAPGDARSDLYSVGVTFANCLAPQRGEQGTVAAGAPSLSAEPGRALPPPLSAWLARALAASPADRYPTAGAMREALAVALAAARAS